MIRSFNYLPNLYFNTILSRVETPNHRRRWSGVRKQIKYLISVHNNLFHIKTNKNIWCLHRMYDRRGCKEFYHRQSEADRARTDQRDLLTKTAAKTRPAREPREVCEDVKGRAVSTWLLPDSANLEACLLCLCWGQGL